MAFYKLDNEQLIEAPNFVSAPNYELSASKRTEYEFPVDGWYWFDNIEIAKSFFKIEEDINANDTVH